MHLSQNWILYSSKGLRYGLEYVTSFLERVNSLQIHHSNNGNHIPFEFSTKQKIKKGSMGVCADTMIYYL
jgi:hypothetical protein